MILNSNKYVLKPAAYASVNPGYHILNYLLHVTKPSVPINVNVDFYKPLNRVYEVLFHLVKNNNTRNE